MNQTARFSDSPSTHCTAQSGASAGSLGKTVPVAGKGRIAAKHTDKLSWLQRFSQQRVVDWLSQIEFGKIELSGVGIHANSGQFAFGSGSPSCRWNIQSPNCFLSLFTGGAMGLAESYMRGDWQCDDLTTLLRILYRHDAGISHFNAVIAKCTQRLAAVMNQVLGNTIARSKQQIAAHYDLSNEFFELFLDPTLMYSSAYFERPSMSLEQASVAKLDQICRKLDLSQGQSVLEIGTGWGGFGLHSVRNYGINLTTTTISQAQYAKAESRFAAAGIESRVRLLSDDYRLLQGQFDKLVSIEMIEAVGEKNLDSYFRQCGKLLRPGGRMVIQAIVMPEQRFEAYRRSVDFIQKYIFPGGSLPSISAMQLSVGRTTDLLLHSVEDLTAHYARTLSAWYQAFQDKVDDVKALGFDDRFIRMWEYYLCYCEAAFQEQAVRVVQIAWDRPLN